MKLVLLAVDALSLIKDLRDDPVIGAVLIPGSARLDLRPVDRDHPDRHQPSFLAEHEHLDEQLADRSLVAATELRDRRMIRSTHRRDQLVGHVLPAGALDSPRRAVAARVRVHQQADHLSSTGRRNAVCP